MKKLVILVLAIVSFFVVAHVLHLSDHLLALLLVGLIPFTQISMPPIFMFFIWALLPVILFFALSSIKGLYLLGLLISEQIEYAYYARIADKKADASNKKTPNKTSAKKAAAKVSLAKKIQLRIREIAAKVKKYISTTLKQNTSRVKINET